MTARRIGVACRVWLPLGVLLLAAGVCAEALAGGQFKPEEGQPGKDVVWVPTSRALVQKMLDMARVTSQDFVTDLGSGDGRTVIAAAKRGARAVGIEYNPLMIEVSRRNAADEGVADRATFINADLFEADLSHATVITMFLLPDINLKLRPKLLDLKPGTRIVSNTFTMQEWQPDAKATVNDGGECRNWCTAFLWIVPAKVGGTWQLANGRITLMQRYQRISGSVWTRAGVAKITAGSLHGTEIRFTVGDEAYSGQVNGNTMQGTVTSGESKRQFRAVRAE
jgi:precorrin-6B methylase 2